MTRAWAFAFTLLMAGLVPLLAAGGTIRHDVADASYTQLSQSYASVGDILFTESGAGYRGSGTLIAPDWVLTAGHIVDGSVSTLSFRIGGTTYGGAEWRAHPNWTGSLNGGHDIGLIRLTTAVANVAPASRYTAASELGRTAHFVGYGNTGTGLTGFKNGTSGTRRAGANVVDAYGSALGYSNNILLADFDDPANKDRKNLLGKSSTLALEYSIAPGDSGGGVFMDFGGNLQLVGVNSFIGAVGGRSGDGVANASYSDFMGATRVTMFNSWIDAVIGGAAASPATTLATLANENPTNEHLTMAVEIIPMPEPGSAALLASAVAACLARRRRGR
jgi:hypothetical protein